MEEHKQFEIEPDFLFFQNKGFVAVHLPRFLLPGTVPGEGSVLRSPLAGMQPAAGSENSALQKPISPREADRK